MGEALGFTNVAALPRRRAAHGGGASTADATRPRRRGAIQPVASEQPPSAEAHVEALSKNAAKDGRMFGEYLKLSEVGLRDDQVLNGVCPPRCKVYLNVPTPLGVVLAELNDAVYIAAIQPGGNVDELEKDKVKVGDRLVGVSSTFGTEIWPVLSLERALAALRTRLGGQVTLVLERQGLARSIHEDPVRISAVGQNESLDIKELVHSFAKLRSGGLPAIQTLAALIVRSAELFKQYAKSGHSVAELDSLYYRLRRAEVPMDNKLLNLAMSAYNSHGACERTIAIFRDFSNANTECYTSYMKACSKLSDFEALEAAKARMERTGVLLSDRTYNTLLAAYASVGDTGRVEKLFAEMTQRHLVPTVVSWNIRMNAYQKALQGKARVEQVFKIFHDMKLRHLRPNQVTYTTLLGACVLSGDLDRAESVLVDMKRDGVSPDTFTYNKLVQGYGDRFKHDAALRLLRTLENAQGDEPRPDKFSYGLTVRACALSGHLEAAMSVLLRMKRAGHQPEAQVYLTLLRAYAQRGEAHNALWVIAEMRKQHLAVDRRSMSTLMHACVESNDGDMALSVYGKMRQMGMAADVVVYTTLIRAHGCRGDTTKALNLLKAMEKDNVQPNLKTWHALLEVCVRCGRPDCALSVLQHMLARGGHAASPAVKQRSITRETYMILLQRDAFCSASEIDARPRRGTAAAYLQYLEQILHELRSAGLYGNGQLFVEMLRTCAEAHEWRRGAELVEMRRQRVFRVSARDREVADTMSSQMKLPAAAATTTPPPVLSSSPTSSARTSPAKTALSGRRSKSYTAASPAASPRSPRRAKVAVKTAATSDGS